MGVAPRGLGPQDPTKKLAQWIDLFGQPLSRKYVEEIFGPEPLHFSIFLLEISKLASQLNLAAI